MPIRKAPLVLLLAAFASACETTDPCASGPGLAISPRPTTLERGDTIALAAEVTEHCGVSASEVVWSSSNGVAAVVLQDGRLIGKWPGLAGRLSVCDVRA